MNYPSKKAWLRTSNHNEEQFQRIYRTIRNIVRGWDAAELNSETHKHPGLNTHFASLLISACLGALIFPVFGNVIQPVIAQTVIEAPEEFELLQPPDNGEIPFSISVDGETMDRSQPFQSDVTLTDRTLEKVNIQIKYDGLDIKPMLNVSTDPIRRTYKLGESVQFRASSNYPDWIENWEVRIFDREGTSQEPLEVIPVSEKSGVGIWQGTPLNETDLRYVLRVFDRDGRFDETAPLPLRFSGKEFAPHSDSETAIAPGEGADRTATRNIPVYGGAVTVFGQDLPASHRANVLGREVPVDEEGQFVVQRILPPGDHNIDVTIGSDKQNSLSFDRQLNIPANDWFYVAIADLTVGKRLKTERIEASGSEEFDSTYTKGRLAFYLKGKIQGKYLLTAAADTKEGRLEDMFRGLDRKDPRQLLRRINADDYYPVYGDGSTTVEDAPTSGKFYVRLDRGDSHVMWGNFKTRITGSEFIRSERTLYGANAVVRSEETTSFGERKTEATAFAAQPGTLQQRDVLRGTGGSAYFLKRQDISIGSEQLTVEVRDRVSGLIVSRQLLRHGEDYEINYIQGVVILKKPLSSITGSDSTVRSGTLDGNKIYLVANYEYTPLATDIDGYTYGGRAQSWVNDHLRVGITGLSEGSGESDQSSYGVDLQVRLSERSYIEVELAQSEGAGVGNSQSTDGGLLFNDQSAGGNRNRTSSAHRIRGQIDLSDVTDDRLEGAIGGYYENREAGFSTSSTQSQFDQLTWGAFGEIGSKDTTQFRFRHDEKIKSDGFEQAETTVDLEQRISAAWRVSVGVQHSDKTDAPATIVGKTSYFGTRTDLGGKLTWSPTETDDVYVFGQKTVIRDGNRRNNHRVGIGAKTQLTDKIDLSGEVSTGSLGVGALAAVGYEPTVDDRYYFGYRLDADRSSGGSVPLISGTDLGVFVFGARRRMNEQLSAFVEHNYDLYGQRTALTETYGVAYTPDAVWTFEGAYETGVLEDPAASDFERHAVSFGGAFKEENRSARAKIEARFEDSEDGSRDRATWLFSGGVTFNTNPDWTLSADLDLAISQSATSDFLNGDFVEGSLGYAYRPINNDEFNALLKYSFLYDMPAPNQVGSNGALGPLQRSHVFSVDGIYELNDYVTLGGKYGYRIGEYALDRNNPDWQSGSAQLGILRVDVNIHDNWELLLEGRVLNTIEVNTTDLGAVVGVYRHFGDNVKAGVGYNFGRFSDSLTDLVHDDQGVFFNVVGKL